MLERREQERAEPALARIPPRQDLLVEQVEEELLREVLGLLLPMALAAHECIERRPIGAAQLLQRGLGRR